MRYLAGLFALLLFAADPPAISLYRLAGGFEMPTGICFPPDGSGRMFVTEQRGLIRIVKNGSKLDRAFLDWRTKVSCCAERGLLGLTFAPSFRTNQTFYINYTDPQGNSVVSRMRVSASDADLGDPNSEQVILRVAQPFANHNGGNLVFGPDGYLYLGFGDGGSAGDPQNNGQRTDTLLGKLLRIDVESGQTGYSVPLTNPFVNNSGARPEIWAIGLRNPWRFSFDRETKDLWIGDVGQDRAEEIDFQPASSKGGENYGWRRMEGLGCYPPGSSCDQTGITLPILEYGRQFGQSVTGGFVYRGSSYAALRGFYLYGDFGSGNVWAVQPQRAGWDNRLVLASQRQISTFGQDESGELYLADYRGDIYRITAGPPLVSANAVVNAASFAGGISAGSLATVFGAGVTSFPGIVQASGFPLPTELAGVSITLNGIRAPIVATALVNGQEQINFQVPYELANASRATMVVNANGQASAPVEVPIVSMQPEIFAVTRDRQNATIWATGLGAVSNQPGTGAAAPALPLATAIAQPGVTIGSATAPVMFAGLAPFFAGLYQINVTIPAGAASGSQVVIATGPAVSKPATLP
jgi:glucose/arabinose dehydrogenase